MVTAPASFGVRGEQLALHSKILGFDETDVLVPHRYDHIQAHPCVAGVLYTLRKRPPGQLRWLACEDALRLRKRDYP